MVGFGVAVGVGVGGEASETWGVGVGVGAPCDGRGVAVALGVRAPATVAPDVGVGVGVGGTVVVPSGDAPSDFPVSSSCAASTWLCASSPNTSTPAPEPCSWLSNCGSREAEDSAGGGGVTTDPSAA